MKKLVYILFVILILFPSCLPWDFGKVDFVQAITGSVQSVDFLSARVEGTIAGLNTGTVSQYGHVWAPGAEEPDLNNPDHGRTDLGERITDGSFISALSGLGLNSQYRYRAYARYEGQAIYGKVNLLTTLDLELTAKVSEGNGGAKILEGNFEGPSAQVSGNVELRLLVSEHGFAWSRVHDLPELGRDSTIALGAMASYGKFGSALTDLPIDNNFYLRSFVVIEGFDTLYSEVVVFHTFLNSGWTSYVFDGPGQEEFFGRNYGYALTMKKDDRVYIGGGQINLLNGEPDLIRALEIFDPLINKYVGSEGPPFGTSSGNKHYASDFHFVIDDTAYVSYNQRTKLASMHISPTGLPVRGVWDMKGDISGLGTEPAWAFVLGADTSKGYVADETGNIWRFDPEQVLDSAWTMVGTVPGEEKVRGVLPFARDEKAYFILENGNMQLFDPAKLPGDPWEPLPDTDTLPGAEDFIVLITKEPDRAFICKDNPALNALYREVWEFDPLAGENWKRMPDFPTYLFDGTTFSFKDKAYLGMGQEAIGRTEPHLGYSLEMWEFTPPD